MDKRQNQTSIVFVHLLNDSSGSPRVLLSAIEALSDKNSSCTLCVGSTERGVLEAANVPKLRYWYRRSSIRSLTFLYFLFSQVLLFARLCFVKGLPRETVLYINTLLPFGAAIWGKVTGRRVIYHIHEVSISPRFVRSFLTGIASWTADRVIYVSFDHSSRLPIHGSASSVIQNPIDSLIAEQAKDNEYIPAEGNFNVLMLASPRDFKGVPEFVGLAQKVERLRNDIQFTLVLNANEIDSSKYLKKFILPANLKAFPVTKDPARFYRNSHLVLNLTRVDKCVETFGLTLAEAMAFGVPVIGPPVGGPSEIIRHGLDGFLIDSRNSQELLDAIALLADDRDLAIKISKNAKKRATAFSFEGFKNALKYEVGI